MSDAGWAVFLWVFGLFVASAAHETGHLLCARFASIPIRHLVIGSGPVLAHWRIGVVQVYLRLFPVGGFVMPDAPAAVQKRWAAALYFLGGALGNVVAIAAIIGLHVAGVAPKLVNDSDVPLVLKQAGLLVGAQVFLIVLSLIPYWGRIQGLPIGSDGTQLLHLWRGTSRYVAALRRYYRGATQLRRPSEAFARIAQALARADRWTSADARSEVHDALRRELGRGGLPPEEEMLVLDALITDGLLFADPALRVELDEWSLRAVELGPDFKTLAGSRGAVLVELGRYQEGKALLDTVALAEAAAPFDTLMTRIFLARAEHSLGNAAVARSLMMQARSTIAGASTPVPELTGLIERIEREMEAAAPADRSASGG